MVLVVGGLLLIELRMLVGFTVGVQAAPQSQSCVAHILVLEEHGFP